MYYSLESFIQTTAMTPNSSRRTLKYLGMLKMVLSMFSTSVATLL